MAFMNKKIISENSLKKINCSAINKKQILHVALNWSEI